MQTLHHTAGAAEDGKKLKHVLRGELQLSSTLLKTLKWREGAIRLNGEAVRVDAIVHAGDAITVTIDEREMREDDVRPIDLPLDIVFEDDCLLVLNKPANLAMHPKSTDLTAPHLAGALVNYLGSGSVPHFVSRLDKGTSGLLIAAKSGYVHELLRRALHTNALRREYLALAIGEVAPKRGIIDRPIAREESSLVKRCCRNDGLPSLTEYEVLSVHDGLSLVHLTPHTGRTHQLRVHMASIGHPLLGDWLYGTEEHDKIARPALHSAFLHFTHPLTGKVLSFEAPLPEDMAKFTK